MKIALINQAARKATEFVEAAAATIVRARKEKPVGNVSDWQEINYTKETAALRRVSMDLTRILAQLRKP